jgi:predicted transcriptional regulator
MLANEAMSSDVAIINSNQSIRAAARLMGQIDAGMLRVGGDDCSVGMITDRDIAMRAVAADKSQAVSCRNQ